MTYAEARAELFNLKGVSEDGSGRRQWGAFGRPGITAGGQVRNKATRPGFYDTQYGMAPTEAEVKAYWKANGGGSKKKSQSSSSDQSAALAAAAAAAPAGEKSAYAKLLEESAASLKSQTEKANAANLERYNQEGQAHDSLYGRVMGEVGNWGGVQSTLNAEEAQRNLDLINANLASSGLSNSTNTIAAKLQSDRNLALVQQDLSEKKSDRTVQYDTALTRDKNDWIRSRFDNAPDPNQLMQVYAKLGEAEAMDKARAAYAQQGSGKRGGSRRSLMERMAGMGGIRGGQGATQAAMNANRMAAQFQGGMAGVANWVGSNGGMTYTPAWQSNAFPHRPGEGRYEAYYRRVNG